MAQLAIKVRGEVLSSNFDEWKVELISQIQSVGTELTTEAQFAQAQTDVKNFKVAEKALKKAKESAISQASDIERLFSAIDEVSAEVRQVRLSLERQIKQRKAEIKEEFIELGIAKVKKYIELQDQEFQLVDYSDYLERGAFLEAMKYRSNINALHGAIDDVCGQIKTQVDEKAALVKSNALKLDNLPIAHQALFQDRYELLTLDAKELNDLVDKRITVFENQTGISSSKQDIDPQDLETQALDEDGESFAEEAESRFAFTLIIELSATQEEAEEFCRMMRSAYAGSPLVRTFQLERA